MILVLVSTASGRHSARSVCPGLRGTRAGMVELHAGYILYRVIRLFAIVVYAIANPYPYSINAVSKITGMFLVVFDYDIL